MAKQIECWAKSTTPRKLSCWAMLLSHCSRLAGAEPFGLVMIESMAAGTPVIGRLGSVPEVIAHGETGFVCQS